MTVLVALDQRRTLFGVSKVSEQGYQTLVGVIVDTRALFQFLPIDFYWNSLEEVYLLLLLRTALKRVSVNRWTNFPNIYNKQNAVWTSYEHFYFAILRGDGKLEKSRH